MNIHEYQAKALLAQFGVPVLPGYACLEQDDVRTVAERLDSPVIVVKSQIHAGGRGAGHFQHNPQGKGGVRIASSVDEAVEHASDMLGKVLVTKQTGENGKRVQRLYLEAGCDIRRELYLSLLVDRACSRVMVMASAEGGMDIEELAETAPEKIVKLAIDPATGISGFHCRNLAFALGFSGAAFKSFQSFLPSLYRAFVELDASLLEINPLVEDKDGRIVALDAKLAFDDNALFRHEAIQALRDESEEDKTEREAERHQLNYVRLDGSIGCMVNGAGLAMATMDIIKLYGGLPANFLDVGGGVTLDRVKSAFEIILKDQNVKGVLVNIFGGIVRCDVIAEGIVQAAEQLAVSVPLVVRLDGTNAKEGRAVIEQSKLKAIAASDLNDAASKIVSACE